MSDRNCLIRPSLGSGMETDAEIGTSPFGNRIIWPVGGDSYLHASDVSSSWVFPRLNRAFVSQGTEVMLDLSSINYLEIKRLSRDIADTDHPQRTVYTCNGREVYDSQAGADPEHLFAVLLTRSRILDLEPGLYRRRAATRQLKILRASGQPLERDDYTDDDLYLVWTLDPRFDQGSSLARMLRLLGWLQPDGQMLGVARRWANGSLTLD